ncbi:hypothetical protein [Roseivirga sp. UBA838]|uniref:hypothetical protein n=1 Tax=Roseivirga sp. UBA838 TaxID=1947393 RepID=UPI00257E436E|nr:hypothetical protein [Roseivirga sp. UBA838]|tara:strand:+ start:7738 stop:7929 length:192 start_codon:yes stop_codon:yes gene_type:complete
MTTTDQTGLVIKIPCGKGAEQYRQRMVISLIELLKLQSPDTLQEAKEHNDNVLELIQHLTRAE